MGITQHVLAMTIQNIISQLWPGYVSLMSIFFLTLLFSLPLGFVIAFARMSSFKPLRAATTVFISVMRGTPLMLQLIGIYYAIIPAISAALSAAFGVGMVKNARFIAVIFGFTINYAAYFAEIYRGGIESVPVGQFEAGEVLGLTKNQTFFRIILPQVFKRILPSMTNEVVTLVKDTSLAFSISYVEMITIAKQLVSTTSEFSPLIVAGIFYYTTNLIIEFIMSRFEKRMNRYE